MSISKLKKKLDDARKNSPNDRRLLRKPKQGVQKAREWKPAFPGQHRGW